MPYDSNYPQDGERIDADPLRQNLNGLHDEITVIPKGDKGDPGDKGDKGDGGDKGDKGDGGDKGDKGDPFASAVVDSTTTLDPGNDASVSASFDGATVHLNFAIPRGQEGPMGQPGEVSQATLDANIAGTARNPAGIGPYGGDFSDPPTQQEMRDFRDWGNSFFNGTAR
jgi:hypothetical protein